MKLLYAIQGTANPLYGGKFGLNGRYRSYGQHSYVLDFVRAATRSGISIDVGVDGLSSSPLYATLRRLTRTQELGEFCGSPDGYDAVLLDEIGPDSPAWRLPGPRVCVVHNARKRYDQKIVERCDAFICMSRSSVRRQSDYIDPSRLVLIEQGVDLQRFRPLPRTGTAEPFRPRVLVISRLDGLKQSVVSDMVSRLASTSADLTVLGDGDAFWPLADAFGERITMINFIPCQSIQNFLPHFDVVVSSARGIMEALACGIPAICVGLGYGGPVTADNLESLKEYNLTGYQLGSPPANICDDVQLTLGIPPEECCRWAAKHFNVEDSVRAVVKLVTALCAGRSPNSHAQTTLEPQ